MRVRRQEVAIRTLVAIERDAVAGEVEQQTVVRIERRGQRLSQQGQQPRAPSLVVEQAPRLEAMIALEHLGDRSGVGDRRAQGCDVVAVRIDADDDGEVATEPRRWAGHGYRVGISRFASGTGQIDRGRTIVLRLTVCLCIPHGQVTALRRWITVVLQHHAGSRARLACRG